MLTAAHILLLKARKLFDEYPAHMTQEGFLNSQIGFWLLLYDQFNEGEDNDGQLREHAPETL